MTDGSRDRADAYPGAFDALKDIPDASPDATKTSGSGVTTASCASEGIPVPAGTVCRILAGACDIEETCDGVSPYCPTDKLVPAGKVCRASVNDCDMAETCSGASPACPADTAHVQPPAPDSLSATPGPLKNTLAWKPITGATGYIVKRSTTTGHGYRILGSAPSTPAPSYVDSGIEGSTPYYYVVSAVNGPATCESTNSRQLRVAPIGSSTPPGRGNGYIVFDDELQDAWADASWNGTYTVNNPSPVRKGTASIAVQYTSPWAGLRLHSDNEIPCAGKTAFQFWGHGGTTGTREVRFFIRARGGSDSPFAVLRIPAGLWTLFTVPLAELGRPADVTDIIIQDATATVQPPFYIDQLELD